eukprot:m.77318 g.77318  ORF g.77318 m.77318 type:complete len:678 (+) comp50496_c0_seq2:10-2043(+)
MSEDGLIRVQRQPAASGAEGTDVGTVFVPLSIKMYQDIFEGRDPARSNTHAWEEFFLLKVNIEYLSKLIAAQSDEQVLASKGAYNLLFARCVATLRDESSIRIANALQILGVLIQNIFKKRIATSAFDIISIFVEFDAAQELLKNLILSLQTLLHADTPALLIQLALNVISTIVTATDNLNQNTFVEYLMITPIFDTLVHLVTAPSIEEDHAYQAITILAFLVNYRKHESRNPYTKRLAELTDQNVLVGLASVIIQELNTRNKQWTSQIAPQTPGVMASFASMMSRWFVAEDEIGSVKLNFNRTTGILLAFYEIVSHNPHFLTVLTHTHGSARPKSAGGSRAAKQGNTSPITVPSNAEAGNLMGTFLTFASFVFQDTKDQEAEYFAKLCFIILTCIIENDDANAFLHDATVKAPVTLFKTSMRHRPSTLVVLANGAIATAVLDTIVEFLVSHLRRNFPLELYVRALNVVHRLLCYQKKHRVRLQFKWKDLWSALVSMASFILANEKQVVQCAQAFTALNHVVTIFNLYITYGDTFLPDPNSYDELYYELIRVHVTFDSLYDFARRYARAGGDYQFPAGKLATDLVNIRAITNHFTPRIESWSITHQTPTLSPDQVLAIVRDNYDTLTLKLQDNLDFFEPFAENPAELPFFAHLLRFIIRANKSISFYVEPIKVVASE